MKLTIRNKLIGGYAALLLLMTLVAANGCVAFFKMRKSAHDATAIGGRLNSVALEIQVHNLEAQRRVKNYLAEAPKVGAGKAKELYLEEAEFEIHEITTLAEKAVRIAPDGDKREKFTKVLEASAAYEAAVNTVVGEFGKGGDVASATLACEAAAEALHQTAEDGEVAGRDASQMSEQDIKLVSDRSMVLAGGFSLAGLILGLAAAYFLSRAILVPVDHLRDVAENVSMGNLGMEVRRYSNDEIGDLADSFSRMLTAVKFFKMEADMANQDVAS